MHDLRVYVNNTDLFNSFGLIITDRVINPPEPQTSYLEVPFRNGSIDLTEAVAGEVKYKDRVIEMSFVYAGDDIQALVASFYAFCHGKKVQVVFSDDSSYKYVGRMSITGVVDRYNSVKINASIVAEPYKLKVTETTKSRMPGANDKLILTNSIYGKRVVPTVTAKSATTLKFAYALNGPVTEISLPAGTTNKPLYEMEIPPGGVEVNIVSTGEVIFKYTEGAL